LVNRAKLYFQLKKKTKLKNHVPELGKMGYLKLKQEPAENGFGPIEMTLTDSFDRNIPKPTFD